MQRNNKAGVEVSDKGIEDCHRVGKSGTNIVKFCKRKVSNQELNVRKNLTKLSMEDLQLTGQGKLYTNQSLCPYYIALWSKSKSLHRMGKILIRAESLIINKITRSFNILQF